VELARVGRLDEVEGVSGLDAAGHLRSVRRQAMAWDLTRDTILTRLSSAGVPTVLLKGAALRLTAYRDPAEREFVDIDVLVPKDALKTAMSTLEAGGYAIDSPERSDLYIAHHHHLLLRHPNGTVVELHWALEPEASPFALDAAAFVADARTFATPGGISVAVPRPEHMVLHLSHQNLENGFIHLRRLVDVDRVVANSADFDWEFLQREAQRMKVHHIVALTLRLAELLLGTAPPRELIESLHLEPAARRNLARLDPVALVLEQRGLRQAVEDLLLLWCLPTRRDRRRWLTNRATGAETGWNVLASTPLAGFRARAAALAKVAAYQAWIVTSAAVGKRTGAKRGFWG
jgi:hypothetical protein